MYQTVGLTLSAIQGHSKVEQLPDQPHPSLSSLCHTLPSPTPSLSSLCHTLPSPTPSLSSLCHTLPSPTPSLSSLCHTLPRAPSLYGQDHNEERGYPCHYTERVFLSLTIIKIIFKMNYAFLTSIRRHSFPFYERARQLYGIRERNYIVHLHTCT